MTELGKRTVSLTFLICFLTIGSLIYNNETIASNNDNDNDTNTELILPPLTTNTNRQLRNQGIPGVPPFPKTFTLEPIVDIPLPGRACFLACVRPDLRNTDLTCHFRQSYRKFLIGKLVLDGTNFWIKSEIVRDKKINNYGITDRYSDKLESLTEGKLLGEDPRSFMWDGDMFVMSNALHKNTLMQIGDRGAIFETPLPEKLGLKNITPVPLTGVGIMFIDFEMEKIHVCVREPRIGLELTCEPFWKNVRWTYADRKGVKKEEWYHRGGTAGVEIDKGFFIGFGHTTNKKEKSHHDMWYWYLDIRGDEAHVGIDYVMIPHGSDFQITDPTSLVHVNDQWYLFTAESADTWHAGTVIINRVYHVKRTPGGEPS